MILKKAVFFLVIGIVLVVLGIILLKPGSGPDELQDQPSEDDVALSDKDASKKLELGPEQVPNRLSLIPEDAIKMLPEMDPFPPVLVSPLWEEPVPMPYPINTAGAEDSPFITPCGCTFYFFFTPDPSVPAELQIVDGVTGIYYIEKEDGVWGEAKRVQLGDDPISLDGCPWVGDDEIWFCSVRSGNLREIDIWMADIDDGVASNVRNVGERLNLEVGLGELHVTADGSEIYFHSDMSGGKGGRDIWVTEMVDGGWSDPINVEAVNTDGSDSLPFVTLAGDQLWFTRWYNGYPAIYVSEKSEGGWSEPEIVVHQFAAEPTLDADGNLYFAHHFIWDGEMLDSDIYVAYKRYITPRDKIKASSRGYYMGVLPTPAKNQSLEVAYIAASGSSEIVPVWGRPSPFFDMAKDLSGAWGEAFVDGLTRENDMVPLVHFSFIDEGLILKTPLDMEEATLSDPKWRLAYKNSVLEAVIASEPAFLSVGNEVNRWYEEYGIDGPNGFRHFVSLYEEIYDDVKELSPKTVVFCTFSREVVDENRESDLDVLDLFDPDKLDILVMTSYPHALAGINRPEDIPDNYYKDASDYLPGKQFGFSEVAWPSLDAFGGEEGQADFLWQLVGRLTVDQGVDLELLMWSWLADLGEEDSVGLVDWSGTEKPAYETWRLLYSGEE